MAEDDVVPNAHPELVVAKLNDVLGICETLPELEGANEIPEELEDVVAADIALEYVGNVGKALVVELALNWNGALLDVVFVDSTLSWNPAVDCFTPA